MSNTMASIRFLTWCLCAVIVTAAVEVQAVGLVVPDGFEIRQIATNLNPTAMRTAPDGRIFFCEKHGAVRVIKNDVLLEDPVLTITSLSIWNERGLLGVAVDPDIETNNWIYIHYVWTDGTQDKGRLSRFTLNGDVAEEDSETVIFETEPYSTDSGIHNGGSILIDNDGKIFLTIGDIGDRTLSQNLTSSFGKILRLNIDGSIPEDNPFYDSDLEGINRAIWAYGFRNSFMTTYDPVNDQAIFGDVGESTWEELNLNQKGANYGWPFAEGLSIVQQNYTRPELTYKHDAGCAITGLAFYMDSDDAEYQFPEQYIGKLLFGDYCKGWIRYIDIYDDIAVRNVTVKNIDTYAPVLVQGTVGGLSMTQGLDGGLYFAERGTSNGASTTNVGVLTGSIYKLIYTGSKAPVIYAPLEQWAPLPTGKTYTLFIGATGAALNYTWYRDDSIVTTARTNTFAIALTAQMNGTRYRVDVANPFGIVTSNEVVLLVSGNTGFGASIWTSQSKYSAGDVIEFGVTITDPTDDPLRLISWIIELSHQKHSHPFASFANVESGNITIPHVGELDPVQGYVFTVFVHNSVVSINTKATISPNLGVVTLKTDPPGLGLIIDEVDTYPVYELNITGVVSMQRIYYAPGAQSIGNDTYVFVGWSDGDTNNEKSVPFVIDSVLTLQANYCSVVDCPDLPLAPITERAYISPPVTPPTSAGPISVSEQPSVQQPTQQSTTPADAGREFVSSSSRFIDHIGAIQLIAIFVSSIGLFL